MCPSARGGRPAAGSAPRDWLGRTRPETRPRVPADQAVSASSASMASALRACDMRRHAAPRTARRARVETRAETARSRRAHRSGSGKMTGRPTQAIASRNAARQAPGTPGRRPRVRGPPTAAMIARPPESAQPGIAHRRRPGVGLPRASRSRPPRVVTNRASRSPIRSGRAQPSPGDHAYCRQPYSQHQGRDRHHPAGREPRLLISSPQSGLATMVDLSSRPRG